ncbi:MAG: hypothetical protein GC161_15315 [Planctomycetaceae bacterium]|nr:hypothetical protein [Planctomycetaceae bacterium]
MHIPIGDHPLLELAVVRAVLPTPLGGLTSSPALLASLVAGAPSPFAEGAEEREAVRQAVRALLRVGGYKPTGRGKPASEYLVGRAAELGAVPSINPAVDACNGASLASGLPISVVDAGRLVGELVVRFGAEGESYVFNASGHSIDLAGLPVLCDEVGPAANAVKDSERTKTRAETRRMLAVVWGTQALPGRAAVAGAHFADLLRLVGAEIDS